MTEMLGSVSRTQHFGIESAVLPAQVEQLPDLTGYLKYASDPTWMRVRLEAKNAWAEAKAGAGIGLSKPGMPSQRSLGADRE
jgi:hypothetical protein